MRDPNQSSIQPSRPPSRDYTESELNLCPPFKSGHQLYFAAISAELSTSIPLKLSALQTKLHWVDEIL